MQLAEYVMNPEQITYYTTTFDVPNLSQILSYFATAFYAEIDTKAINWLMTKPHNQSYTQQTYLYAEMCVTHAKFVVQLIDQSVSPATKSIFQTVRQGLILKIKTDVTTNVHTYIQHTYATMFSIFPLESATNNKSVSAVSHNLRQMSKPELKILSEIMATIGPDAEVSICIFIEQLFLFESSPTKYTSLKGKFYFGLKSASASQLNVLRRILDWLYSM